jgi:acyl carrier protein
MNENPMDSKEIRSIFLDVIDAVAPGSVPADVDDDADIREQMDLDSMDLLNVIEMLHDRLGVEVPDADIEKLTTVNKAIAYLV